MTLISTNTPTAELQALDAAHHMHPFTTGADLARLRRQEINIALVGEHLMREPDPGEALQEILQDLERIEARRPVDEPDPDVDEQS